MTDNEIVKAWIVVLENKRMPTEYLINVTIDRIDGNWMRGVPLRCPYLYTIKRISL